MPRSRRRIATIARLTHVGALILPAAALVVVAFGGAMAVVLIESFRAYTPGRIIQSGGPFTLENYATFMSRAYGGIFLTTIRLPLVSALISTLLAYPIAYRIARGSSARLRRFLLAVTILTLFLGGMVRVVSLVTLLGGNGLLNSILGMLGIPAVALIGRETGVLIGFVHFQVPVAVLTLIGAIATVDPAVEEAAQSLGASRARTFWTVTLPLTAPGILGASILAFAAGVSAFAMPLFLGRGIVNLTSNLIYDRFSDVLNFPEGAALAVILLLMSLFVTVLFGESARLRRG